MRRRLAAYVTELLLQTMLRGVLQKQMKHGKRRVFMFVYERVGILTGFYVSVYAERHFPFPFEDSSNGFAHDVHDRMCGWFKSAR